jgi:hypothetical protein
MSRGLSMDTAQSFSAASRMARQRPGFVRAACHPPRQLPDQAALNFNHPAPPQS